MADFINYGDQILNIMHSEDVAPSPSTLLQLRTLFIQFLNNTNNQFLCWALEHEYSSNNVSLLSNISAVESPTDKTFLSSVADLIRFNNDVVCVVVATGNKTYGEYGECGKSYQRGTRWARPGQPGTRCGSKNCGGQWHVDDDSLEFYLSDFESLVDPADPAISYNSDFTCELKEEDVLNHNVARFWGKDQGDGCSGPGYKAHAERDRWYRVKVVIISKLGSEFSDTLENNEVDDPAPANRAAQTWQQPGANVPNHPAVTRFLLGPDRTFRYINFSDLQHAKHWANKHANDRGCFMKMVVGVDEYGFAYADITKTRFK